MNLDIYNHVCVCVLGYVHIYVFHHVCLRVCVLAYNTGRNGFRRASVYVFVCLFVCLCAHMCVCVCVFEKERERVRERERGCCVCMRVFLSDV